MTIYKLDQKTNLEKLSPSEVFELQDLLKKSGFYNGSLDGLLGNKTKLSFKKFKEVNFLSDPEYIGKSSVDLLKKRDFNSLCIERSRFYGLTLPTQIAYILATVDHETNGTMLPVKEAYWLSEEWRSKNLRYYPYYGRGYVQITWKENYEKFSKILGVDMVKNLDLALEPIHALEILIYGFKNGTFTGLKLEDFINKSKTDYKNARKCINGLDKADHIANIAINKYIPLLV